MKALDTLVREARVELARGGANRSRIADAPQVKDVPVTRRTVC